MAINKVINDRAHNHGAMRNVIEYVLRDDKVREGLVFVTGPYETDTINWDGVYRSFLEEKRLWGKDSGRMYSHMIISFHKEEAITPEECLEFGKAFVDENFPDHQCVAGVHQDKEHLHLHCVINSVSFIDGHKLHSSKQDLQRLKERTNRMCRDRGLTVAEKGRHFDGTRIERGEVMSWDKNKYKLLQNETKPSFVANCGLAVMEALTGCASREEFINGMNERGWSVTWTDNRKHITFENEKGEKVRDSNLNKTFGLNIGREELIHEFERQRRRRERVAAERESEPERTAEAERELYELEQYYVELEQIAAGAGSGNQSFGREPCDREIEELKVQVGASERAREERETEQERLRAEAGRREREERERAERRSRFYYGPGEELGIGR